MTEIHTAERSLADLKALVAEMEREAASATRDVAQPLVEHLFTTNVITESKTGTWVGFSDSVEMTVDGKRLHVKVVVTDVDASEARKAAQQSATKQTKKQAETEALKARLAELEASA